MGIYTTSLKVCVKPEIIPLGEAGCRAINDRDNCANAGLLMGSGQSKQIVLENLGKLSTCGIFSFAISEEDIETFLGKPK